MTVAWSVRARSAALILSLIFFGGAGAADGPLQVKASDYDRIQGDLRTSGQSRVIVELVGPTADRADPKDGAESVARLRALQDAVIADVLGAAPGSAALAERRIKRMSVLPMLALTASSAELDRLASDARVAKIFRDDKEYPHLNQSVPLIGADAVVASGPTGNSRIVAVLDTGVRSDHEFLSGKVVGEACFSTEADGFDSLCPGDVNGTGPGTGAPCTQGGCDHGTHVAGIAAGFNTSLNGSEPRWGVARRASIFAIQVFSWDFGEEKITSFNSDTVLALEHVFNTRNDFLPMRIDAVNMSLGGSVLFTSACDSDDPRTGIINMLRQVGIATVISAGNDSSRTGGARPGCISSAITVASSTKSDVISDFSNMYPVVDVVAPGSGINSSVPSGYGSKNGTSMAAPHVAGAIALIRFKFPSATVDQIESALELTGKFIADTRSGGTISRPRIQLVPALVQAGPRITVGPVKYRFREKNRGNFKPSEGVFTIRSSPSTSSWKVEGGAAWLNVEPRQGLAGDAGATVRVSINTKFARRLFKNSSTTLRFVNTLTTVQPPIPRKVYIVIKPVRQNARGLDLKVE